MAENLNVIQENTELTINIEDENIEKNINVSNENVENEINVNQENLENEIEIQREITEREIQPKLEGVSLRIVDGVEEYGQLKNLPQIEGVTLINNKTFEDLGAFRITNIEIERMFENE